MKTEYVLLNEKTILNNIINLNQLTFEVTDACNLKCKYCGYGEFYGDYDKRHNKNLSVDKAISLLSYLIKKWESSLSTSYNKTTYISFYGGEPLLNTSFIKTIVEWVNKQDISQCDFRFTMTTNGVLLKRHIDFLVENNFQILVSLDGSEKCHSYRVDHKNNNSFDKVYKNMKYIQKKYPFFLMEI